MPRVRCHHGEAALQAGLSKRSRIAPDSRGDDAIVATTALIQEPATPRGRQSQFETGLAGELVEFLSSIRRDVMLRFAIERTQT